MDLATRYREFLAIALAGGESAEVAEIRSTVGVLGLFCLSSSGRDDPALQPCINLFSAMGQLIDENGGEAEDLVEAFLPRFPFDILLDPEGRTAADLLLQRHGASLPKTVGEAVRALIEAEDAVCRVDRSGNGVVIEDLRSGVRLPGPEGWKPGMHGMVCRLVAYRGRHIPLAFEGIDDPADPCHLEAQEEAINAGEQLLEGVGLKLRSRWKGVALGEEVLDMAMNRESSPDGGERRPNVRNTDGDELVFTSLRWDVSDEAAGREALSRLDGLELEETPEGFEGGFVRKAGRKGAHMPGGIVSIGTLSLKGSVLTVETNSVERAGKLRRKVDKALGRAASFRTITSEPLDEAMNRPVDPRAAARREAEQAELMSHPEVREAMEKMGRDHSLAWCDMVIPALGNRRPRTAVRTEKGRQKVEELLADFERRQAGPVHNPMAMDLKLIRKELGLARDE